MAYEIKNGQIVAKDTNGTTRKFIKNNVDVVISECKRLGITNKYLIAGILAVISKESGFEPKNENLNYSEEGLRKTFGSYFKSGRRNAADYAKQPEKIANYIYGGTWKDGVYKLGRYGNTVEGDGFKYRGRGFNQITFKSGYEKYQAQVAGIIDKPDLLNNPRGAATANAQFFVNGFNNTKTIKKNYGKAAFDMSNWDEALLLCANVNAGLGKGPKNDKVIWAYNNSKKCHAFLIEYLEKNPEGLTAPPETPSNISDTTGDTDAQTQQQNEIQQQGGGGGGSDNNTSYGSNDPITNLTQLFKPTLVPTDISFDSSDITEWDQKSVAGFMGYYPLFYIRGYQIKTEDLQKFKLYHKGILPVIEVTFFDSLGLLKGEDIPKDDSKATIFINSRSKNLRSIHMDFKIFNFRENGEGSYTVIGVCNIPEIYLRKFKSYRNKTSHETLQEIARECGLGFCSNISNSDDKMSWLNTGFKNSEFIENIMLNSYVSDQSFQHCYVDFYYNLCYIDLNKELNRDISQDKMIEAFGSRYLGEKENQEADETVVNLLLTTDKATRVSVSFIEKFKIINNSTKVSLKKSYRTKTKYYDSVKKELLVFDVESQTSDGSKSIILKGDPNDSSFFENNTNFMWAGKIDSFEEGKGNVHKNYNYSISQNRQNLDDITKFTCKFFLPNPNHNLYVYQKVPVIFSVDVPTPAVPDIAIKRLTGEWLITGIELSFVGGQQYQVLTAVLRELSLIKGEESQGASRANKGDDNQKQSTNELSPNDQPAPEPNSGTQSIGETTTGGQSEPFSPGENGDMKDDIPEAPERPTKSTPSGFALASGSYSKNANKKTQVIFHYTAGWQKADRNQATIKTLYDRGLTYHYIIDVTGHIENLVPPEYKAYHAKQANSTSIGISMACLGCTPNVENGSVYKNRTGDYKFIENYVNYCDINLQPKTWRGITRGQEVSEKQLVSLLKLLKYLRQRIPTLPAWNGLNETKFYTVFGDGKPWRSDLPGYFTHGSITAGKVDAAPTPRFVQFLKNNRW